MVMMKKLAQCLKVLLILFFSATILLFIAAAIWEVPKASMKTDNFELEKQTANHTSIKHRALSLFAMITEKRLNFSIIEPHFLWNLIPSKQDLLRNKRFDVRRFIGQGNVLTLAVYEEDVEKLVNVTMNKELERYGFQRWVLRPKSRAEEPAGAVKPKNVLSHIIYRKSSVLIHVVVFREMERYLWSWKLDGNSTAWDAEFGPFVFGRTDAIFDKFQMIRYDLAKTRNLYVPLDITGFLFQLETARYVPCGNKGKAFQQQKTNSTTQEGDMPLPLFIETTQSVIQELKKLLDPSMTRFWLACGTLLGWHRDCGLIPFTHDVDFGAWGTDLDDNLIGSFQRNHRLKMRYALGKKSEDMEFWLQYQWLAVDLFFVYSSNASTHFHVGAHRPGYGYSFKYIYPKFELCSTDFLKYRVLVPCDPEPVLKAEYGPDWRIPKEKWNYEMSARNVLGRRYWDEEEVDRYQIYVNS